MENCLITKLKGNVVGDDFPTLNTIYLDVVDGSGANINLLQDESFLIQGVADDPVTVEFAQPVNIQSTENYVTTYKIGAIGVVFVISKDIIKSGGYKNFIKISGTGIYKLRRLASYHNGVSFSEETRKNLSSLAFNNNLAVYGGGFYEGDTIFPPNLKYLSITRADYSASSDLRNYKGNFSNLEYITSQLKVQENTIMAIIEIASLTNLNKLKGVNARCRGNFEDFPLNIEVIGSESSFMVGTIEGYVEKCRRLGRTTGLMRIANNANVNGTTYKGVPIGSQPDVIPIINGRSYLRWDADTISWDSVEPEPGIDLPSLFFYEID